LDDPSHLEHGLDKEVASAVLAAENARNDATTGLKLYMRCLPGMKGEELLTPMTKFSMRTHKGSPSPYGISSHLAVVSPATGHQRNSVSMSASGCDEGPHGGC
jgi:hypothetical protein